MKDCQDVTRLLGPFLAMELAADAERAVREHLAACPRCRATVEATEPAVGLALRLAQVPAPSDEGFVAGVLAGVHQRRVERAVRRRVRGWAVAAAVVMAVLAGYAGLRGGLRSPDTVASREAAEDTVFVEVEGEGVTVYQLASSDEETVQVALIVDPGLRL